MVVRADGNDGQRGVGFVHQRLKDVMDGPVTAGSHDEAAPLPETGADGLSDVETEYHIVHLETGVDGRLRQRRQLGRGEPRPRRRVDEHQTLADSTRQFRLLRQLFATSR